MGFQTSDTGTVITSHNINYSDPNQIFITDPRGWGGPGYYNNRIVNDRIWQYHGEISKDLQSSFLSNIAVGANWTNHSKSLTPDEYFVRFADLTGNIGVQAVHTDQSSTGFTVVPNGSGGNVFTANKRGAKYWDVMPSLNLSLRFPSDWVVRAGLAREVSPRLGACGWAATRRSATRPAAAA